MRSFQWCSALRRGGARALTGSSGVGVTYAFETYSPIAGGRIPLQMMIADRALDPPGDFGSEHTDAMSCRDQGWLMGWAENPQEAFDNCLINYRVGEDHRVLLPPAVIKEAIDDYNRIFGRDYSPFIEESMTDDAEIAFFIMGAHTMTARHAVKHLREQGVKIGLVKLRIVRPWPTQDVAEALSKFKGG